MPTRPQTRNHHVPRQGMELLQVEMRTFVCNESNKIRRRMQLVRLFIMQLVDIGLQHHFKHLHGPNALM
jgi:hypothetical protein